VSAAHIFIIFLGGKKELKRETSLLLGVLSFIVPYTLINNFSQSRNAYQLMLPIDTAIPFVASFVLFYSLTFVYILVAPYLLIKDKKKFFVLALSFIFTMLMGYLTFLLFPVKTILRVETFEPGIWSSLVKITYFLDAPGFNNFPSLHVALSLLVSLIIYDHNKKHWWVWIAFILITLSTMLIKQHYFIDAVAGVLLGIIGFLVYLWMLKQVKSQKFYKEVR
jgi:membrane-associated phospholipid phosphatase